MCILIKMSLHLKKLVLLYDVIHSRETKCLEFMIFPRINR